MDTGKWGFREKTPKWVNYQWVLFLFHVLLKYLDTGVKFNHHGRRECVDVRLRSNIYQQLDDEIITTEQDNTSCGFINSIRIM